MPDVIPPPAADPEAQTIYNELSSRGVFKSDPEAQIIGHELRARGVVSDPTQGGLVPQGGLVKPSASSLSASDSSLPASDSAPLDPPFQAVASAVARWNAKSANGTLTPTDTQTLRQVIATQTPLMQATGKMNSPEAQAAFHAYKAAGIIDKVPNFTPNPMLSGFPNAPTPPSPAASGIPSNPSSGVPASPGPLWNTLDALGMEGREGSIHKGLGKFGQNLAGNARTLGQSALQAPDLLLKLTGNDPAQYSAKSLGEADAIAQGSQQQAGRGLVKAQVNGVIGPQSLLGHGAAAVAQGPQAFGKFAQGVPAGIGKEAFAHPIDEALNVLSLVGMGQMSLSKGAEGALSASAKMTQAADAAEAAGNMGHAASLRRAAQTSRSMGEDLQVAATRYHRAATGGPVGDYAANTAASLMSKYFPGSSMAGSLTKAAVNRGLGKAVSDAYDGYKVQRDQTQGRIIPRPGDVNLGNSPTNNSPMNTGSPVGSSPVGPLLRPSLPVVGSRPLLAAPARPLTPMAGVPAAVPPTPSAPQNIPPKNIPSSVASPQPTVGKSLHPTAEGANGAARHSDGTFAPAALPAQDARLVPGFPTQQLHLDPERFQYKIGYGQGGSSGSLTGAQAFNPEFAGVVHAWRDPADGKAYVVNGHNRVGLAQRTGTPGVDVRFLDASDAAEARTKGALINIAEGQGTALDAAKLFRESGMTPQDIGRLGVNLTGQKASQGLALANLSPGLFHQAMRGELPLERAAIIGGRLPGHGDQATLLKQMGDRNLTNGQIGEMADSIAAGPRHASQTRSLFGTEEISTSLAPERAEAADYINSQLAREGGAFGNASKNADRLARGNNQIDAAESARLATLSAQGREIFGQVKNAPGEVSDMLNAAAKRLARSKETGETRDAIKRDTLGQYQSYVERFTAGGNAHGSSADPDAGGSLAPGAGRGGDGRQQAGSLFGGVRPSRGIYEGTRSGRPGEDKGTDRQTYPRNSLAPPPAITPSGSQVALKGKSGTVYVSARAYQDMMRHLGAPGTSQGVTLKPDHVAMVQDALREATQDAAGSQDPFVRTPAGRQQYLSDLHAVADHLTRGIAGKPGLSVVKVEPGQTLSETKAVSRHERTHVASYDYPLSQASREALSSALSQPSHPLHGAYVKARKAMNDRGYARDKTWDEIPAVLSAGPTQYSKMGLSDSEAEGLLDEYAAQIAAEHGVEAVRALFAHGASAARQVARQSPSVPVSAPSATPARVRVPNATPETRLDLTFGNTNLRQIMQSGGMDTVRAGVAPPLKDLAEMVEGARRRLSGLRANATVQKAKTQTAIAAVERYVQHSTGQPLAHFHPDAAATPDQSKFQDITRYLGPPRLLTADEIADVRKAGLLSSPKQVVKAVAGHLAAMGSDELARIPAAATDFLVSAATGKDRTVGNIRVQDLMQAARRGATEGIKLGATVMRHGSHGLASRGMSHPLLPANHPDFHTGMGLLDTYVNGVFRMHEGAYAALRVFALHRALLELAHLGALNSVRRGLIPKAQQEALRQHLYSQPSPTMLAAAISAAEEATLTNSNAFSKMYQGAYDKAPAAGRFLMNQTVPFPKIESNVAGRSLEMAGGAAYAPLRFALQVMKQHGFNADDQRKFSMTFGRGLVGLGLISLGVMIAAKKKGQPSDEAHHQPGSVQLFGRSYPTNTIAPLSNLLQFGIDVVSGKGEEGKNEEGAWGHAGDAVANLLMEQPYLKANPGDLTEMLTSGTDAKKQIGNQLGSYVPSILADVAAQTDPYKRRQAEPLDFVKNRIPGLRQSLPVSKDLLGNPRMESPNRLVNPFGGTPLGASDTPAMRLLGQDLSTRKVGGLGSSPARQSLTRGILDQAARGKDIRPSISSALSSHQLTLPQARRLISESRLSPMQQHFDSLPLGNALDVYALGNASEKAQWEPVLLRKIAGAARARTLTPEMMQKAQGLGIGARGQQ